MSDEVTNNQLQLEEYFNQITELKPSFTEATKSYIKFSELFI